MDGTCAITTRLRMLGVLLFGVLAGMGCMSFNLGNTYEKALPTSYVDNAGLLRQHDETHLAKLHDGMLTIYYPRPYASKPNLKFLKTSESLNPKEIELVEQAPDRFTIRWRGTDSEPLLAWQAEGVPAANGSTLPPSDGKPVSPVNGER